MAQGKAEREKRDIYNVFPVLYHEFH